MNTPNKLTVTRVLLIPVVCVLVALEQYVWAAGVFAVGALTDFLDGYLARRDGLVTVFGKFLDPVADKLLVLTAMIMLTEKGLLPAWAVAVVAARELAVDGLRLVASGSGKVVAAKMPGKIKTTLQLLCVLSAMLLKTHWLTAVLTAAMALMTVYSGALYFRELWHYVWKADGQEPAAPRTDAVHEKINR